MSTGERSHGVAIGALGGGSTVGTGMLHTEGVKCRNRVVKVPGGGEAAKRRCVTTGNSTGRVNHKLIGVYLFSDDPIIPAASLTVRGWFGIDVRTRAQQG